MDISDYLYELPEDRIARYPVEPRDASKLLVCRGGRIDSMAFRDLPGVIEPGCLMVFNDTRVIQARLRFEKPGGARIEIFCLEPHDPPDYAKAFQSTGQGIWKCLVGNARKWKSGPLRAAVPFETKTVQLSAELLERRREHFLVRFSWTPSEIAYGDLLNRAGHTPLPPYLNREAETADKDRYQTVYARHEGSVAAPTAGLHFTGQVLSELEANQVKSLRLTLHVGAGTFRPVVTADPREHRMHPEHFFVTKSAIRQLLEHRDPLIAVGTTTARMLESIYWIGMKLSRSNAMQATVLNQWEAYELKPGEREEALSNLIASMESSDSDALECITSLMIIPGYRFRMLEGLITNTHQPGSTLLLLVAALMGPEWRRAYQYALDHDYRFLSYGDSMYIRP